MALRGTATSASSSTSTTVAVDLTSIGVQTGDIIILAGSAGGSGAPRTTTCTGYAAPSGWANQAVNGQTIFVLTKTAVGGEGVTTVTVSGSADFRAMEARVYSGRSGVITASAVTGPVAIAAPPITLAITGVTAAAGDDVVVVGGADNGDGNANAYTYTAPGGFTNGIQASGTTAFLGCAFGCDKLNVSAGATGTIGGTIARSGGGAIGYGAMVFALASSSVTVKPVVPQNVFHSPNLGWFENGLAGVMRPISIGVQVGQSLPFFSGLIANQTYTQNTGTQTLNAAAFFTGATSYSLSPAPDTGISINSATGLISVNTATTVPGVHGSYLVNGINANGSVQSNAFTITENTAVTYGVSGPRVTSSTTGAGATYGVSGPTVTRDNPISKDLH